jgi:hypothetical protein
LPLSIGIDGEPSARLSTKGLAGSTTGLSSRACALTLEPTHCPSKPCLAISLNCLREKRKTAFLIAQSEAASHPGEHELIQQLLDFKLIHVIEPDTSAASGRTGRCEAYALDFALFMEPRLRGLEHVELEGG